MGPKSRYYFNVRNDDIYPDENGTCLSGVEEANAYGLRVAHELAEEGTWDGCTIVITDESGNEIARIPVKPPSSTI
jgi:hypothetical protein